MLEREDLIFPKESYELVGCAYAIFNRLKFGYHEKHYQRAYSIELDQKGYSYSRELKVHILYQGKNIGRYFLDFLVERKIVVELKVANNFHPKYIK